MKFKKIGEIVNSLEKGGKPEELMEEKSRIVLEDEFIDGLFGIEENSFIQVIFYLDRSEGYSLKAPRREGKIRGVFNSRSPQRPNPVGVTSAKLVERKGNELLVEGLDALNGTPVIDIKPYADLFDYQTDRDSPRKSLNELIEMGCHRKLLERAGELHGHYCPFLALGVRAGALGLKELEAGSDGMEEVVAVVETNSCFSDGVQFSTGCTFGNNGLVYRDFGRTAVTLKVRDGDSIRISVKDKEELIDDRFPEAAELFEKVVKRREGDEKDKESLSEAWKSVAFNLVSLPNEELFKIERDKDVELPDYAPIFDDAVCQDCGEKLMAPKSVKINGETFCRACAESSFFQLDGKGILKK